MQEYDKNKVLEYQRDINRTSQIMGAPKSETKKNLLKEKKKVKTWELMDMAYEIEGTSNAQENRFFKKFITQGI